MYERYTRLKILDSVQKDYKERMNLCYVAFIDILGFKDWQVWERKIKLSLWYLTSMT